MVGFFPFYVVATTTANLLQLCWNLLENSWEVFKLLVLIGKSFFSGFGFPKGGFKIIKVGEVIFPKINDDKIYFGNLIDDKDELWLNFSPGSLLGYFGYFFNFSGWFLGLANLLLLELLFIYLLFIYFTAYSNFACAAFEDGLGRNGVQGMHVVEIICDPIALGLINFLFSSLVD